MAVCAPFAHTVICLIVKQFIYEAGSRGSSPRTAANARSAWSPIRALPSLLSKRVLQYMHAALGAQLGHRSPAAQAWRPGGCCMVGWHAERTGWGSCARPGAGLPPGGRCS